MNLDGMVASRADDLLAPARALLQGQMVSRGQPLLALEAMKMEHAMVVPFQGVVAELSVCEGGQVSENTILVRIRAVG